MPSTPLDTRPETTAYSIAPPTPGASDASALRPRRAAKAPTLGTHVRRAFISMRRVFKTTYHDPKFEQPDMIEDDYYRLRQQPRGF